MQLEVHHRLKLSVPEVLFRLREDLRADGGDLRIVGGFLRDAVRGDPCKDIDLIHHDPFRRMGRRLGSLGIEFSKPYPFALYRGSIDGTSFDCLALGLFYETLDEDAWIEDLHQRDFTMNAMSSTLEGEIFDPSNGWEAARAGRVAWNGWSIDKIASDPLRVLRFVRFSLRYGQALDLEELEIGPEGFDSEILGSLLRNLSTNRVMDELEKLLKVDQEGLGRDFLELLGASRVFGLPESRVRFHDVGPDVDIFDLVYAIDRDSFSRLLDLVLSGVARSIRSDDVRETVPAW